MALNAGNAACSTGFSKTLYDYWTGDATNGFSGSMSADQTAMVKSLCYAIARAVVYEMQSRTPAQTVHHRAARARRARRVDHMTYAVTRARDVNSEVKWDDTRNTWKRASSPAAEMVLLILRTQRGRCLVDPDMGVD